MLNIILLGPPGAGKGTLAKKLLKHYKFPHISTGDMFREAIKEGTALGRLAASYINQGHLVPDEVTIGLVKERLAQADCGQGFLLDGFPRTLPQAEALVEIGKEIKRPITSVINVTCAKDELVRRITGRRVCRSCGAPYHIDTMKSKVADVCDLCGGELYLRKDDTKELLEQRLEHYENDTRPLENFYDNLGLLKTVDGGVNADVTFEEAVKILTEVA